MHGRDWFRRLCPIQAAVRLTTSCGRSLRHHVERGRERLRDAGVPDEEAAGRTARQTMGKATFIRGTHA